MRLLWNTRLRSIVVPFIAVALLGLAGCGGSAASVHGRVIMDGTPISEGRVSFIPADNSGSAVGGDIKHGDWFREWLNIKHKLEIQIAKQRNGPEGKLEIYFDAPSSALGDK